MDYVFNLAFDHSLKRLTGSTRKTLPKRFVHAISFAFGLMIAFLPVIAWRYHTVFPAPDTGEELNPRA